METIIQEKQCGNDDRHQRWARLECADLFVQYGELHTQGLSQRQAAKVLAVPRTTLQAWRRDDHLADTLGPRGSVQGKPVDTGTAGGCDVGECAGELGRVSAQGGIACSGLELLIRIMPLLTLTS